MIRNISSSAKPPINAPVVDGPDFGPMYRTAASNATTSTAIATAAGGQGGRDARRVRTVRVPRVAVTTRPPQSTTTGARARASAGRSRPGRAWSHQDRWPPLWRARGSRVRRRAPRTSERTAQPVAKAAPFSPLPSSFIPNGRGLLLPRRAAASPRDPDEGGHRGRDRLQHAAHHGVVPDAAGVPPLPFLVDTAVLGGNRRVGHAEPVAERPQRRDPEFVFLPVPAERHADLVDRVAGPHQHLRLHDGAVAGVFGGERDPAGEHVPL